MDSVQCDFHIDALQVKFLKKSIEIPYKVQHKLHV